MRRDDTVFAALTYWMGIIVGVCRSDIQDRIALILAFSVGSGYRSDETDPNSIFCIATIVLLLLSPTKATNTL